MAPPTPIASSPYYEVITQAKVQYFPPRTCASKKTCSGNNPSSLYIVCTFEDARYADNDYNIGAVLNDQEAMVLEGIAGPKKSIYYSYAAYVARQVDDATGNVYDAQASLCDAVNNWHLTPGTPFVFVISANESLVEEMCRVANLAKSHFFSAPIPSDFRLGNQPGKDSSFGFLTRVVPFNRESSNAQPKPWQRPRDVTKYLRRPPLTCSIVRRIKPFVNPRYYQRVKDLTLLYAPRDLSRNENKYLPLLIRKAVELRLELLESRIFHRVKWVQMANYIGENGYECLNLPGETKCFYDNRDCLYLNSKKILMGPQDLILYLSVNHTLVGKTTYSSMTVTDTVKKYAPASFVDIFQKPYEKFLIRGLFYRKNIPSILKEWEKIEVGGAFPGIPIHNDISVTQRLYQDPQSGIGPAKSTVLMAFVFLCQRSR